MNDRGSMSPAQIGDEGSLADVRAIRDRQHDRLDTSLPQGHHERVLAGVITHDRGHADCVTAVALSSRERADDAFQPARVAWGEHVKNREPSQWSSRTLANEGDGIAGGRIHPSRASSRTPAWKRRLSRGSAAIAHGRVPATYCW
jgi:hypothetical protein